MLELLLADCRDVLAATPDASIDLIVADLPFNQSSCEWDGPMDFAALWVEFRRILTPTGTLLSFGSGPHAYRFAAPALDLVKYDLVWRKPQPTNHFHVRNRPRVQHETVTVFSKGTAIHPTRSKRRMTFNPDGACAIGSVPLTTSRFYRAPQNNRVGKVYEAMLGATASVLDIAKDARGEIIHQTQKPVALLEWLVSAYSNPGDLVLDPTMGSGTTGIACAKLGRDFIGVEKDEKFFAHAEHRILAASVEELPIAA